MLRFVFAAKKNIKFVPSKSLLKTCLARMSMKAVVVHEYGDSSKLSYEDAPIPTVGKQEV